MVRAQSRIDTLQQAQRLQRALYEIADLASSNLEMGEVLGRIHALVGGLMYAANFFIVLFDEVRQSVRFLYFADQRDTWVPDPTDEIPMADMTGRTRPSCGHPGWCEAAGGPRGGRGSRSPPDPCRSR